jgi:hypothetical protein
VKIVLKKLIYQDHAQAQNMILTQAVRFFIVILH